jgi:hypothetical protein
MFKKILLAAVIGASFGAVPLAALAQRVNIIVAPPPPRSEVVPAPRRGFEWAPGHWEWRNRRHVWTAGHWVQARRGYSYEAPRWVENNGRWNMNQGRWVRATRNDRDGDGVRNSRDSAPNNPNRN